MEMKGYQIRKLDGNNYFLWKMKLEMVLQKEKLWNVVEEDAPSPITDEWRTKDLSARATIGLSVEDKILVSLINCKTSKQTWRKLKDLYEHTNLTSRLLLLKRLYGSKHSEHKCMEDYLNHIKETTERLRAIGKTIQESHLIAIILCGLPEIYASLVTALEAKDESELTVEYVAEKLRGEAQKKESTNNREENFTAALTANNKVNQVYPRGKIFCHQCGQEGHIRRNCNNIRSTLPARQNEYKNCECGRRLQVDYDKAYQQCYSNTSQQPEEEVEWNLEEEWALTGSTIENQDVQITWIMDSGATSHMTNNEKQLENVKPIQPPTIIQMANGEKMEARSKGELVIHVKDNGIGTNLWLKDILFVPDIKHQLISIPSLCKDNHVVEFHLNTCKIENLRTKDITQAEKRGNLFIVKGKARIAEMSMSACRHTWHRRLGHRSIQGVASLEKANIVGGMKISKCDHSDFCRTCPIGSMKQTTFKKSETIDKKPFHTLVSDICGPISPETFGKKRYLLTVTDNFSNYTFVEVLTLKSDAAASLIKWLTMCHNRFNYWPKVLRTDGGGEYGGETLNSFLELRGIQHQRTVPHTPQQNGKAERKNQTLFNMIRCMLKGRDLPLELWGEAAYAAVHILNRVQHQEQKVTPYELWKGSKPKVGYFKEFGIEAFAYVPKAQRKKLSNHAIEARMVGYGIGQKGYRLWIPNTKRVITAISVKFNEDPPLPIATETKLELNTSSEVPMILQLNNSHGDERRDQMITELRRSSRSTKVIPPPKYTCDD